MKWLGFKARWRAASRLAQRAWPMRYSLSCATSDRRKSNSRRVLLSDMPSRSCFPPSCEKSTREGVILHHYPGSHTHTHTCVYTHTHLYRDVTGTKVLQITNYITNLCSTLAFYILFCPILSCSIPQEKWCSRITKLIFNHNSLKKHGSMAMPVFPFLWFSHGHVRQTWLIRYEEKFRGNGFWESSLHSEKNFLSVSMALCELWQPSLDHKRSAREGMAAWLGWAAQRLAVSQGIFQPKNLLP